MTYGSAFVLIELPQLYSTLPSEQPPITAARWLEGSMSEITRFLRTFCNSRGSSTSLLVFDPIKVSAQTVTHPPNGIVNTVKRTFPWNLYSKHESNERKNDADKTFSTVWTGGDGNVNRYPKPTTLRWRSTAEYTQSPNPERDTTRQLFGKKVQNPL